MSSVDNTNSLPEGLGDLPLIDPISSDAELPAKTDSEEPAVIDILGIEEPDEVTLVDLDPFLMELWQKEPFWSLISRRITKRRTRAIPTAGVTVRKSEFVMVWNDVFMDKLTFDEKIGVLKHEFSHLVYDHVTARRRENHKLWNIATDLAINSMLPLDQLPEICLLPGRELKYNPEMQKMMTPEQKLVAEKLSEKIKSFPLNHASDWYYDQLVQSGISQEMEDAGMDGLSFHMDDHDGWTEVPESERELMRGKLKDIIEGAVREADAKNAWGSIPEHMREMLRRLISREINWKAVLRNFIGFCQSSTRSTTIRKINRRFPYVHPGVKKGHQARMAIGIDQSGSVDDHSLEKVFGELNTLSKQVEFTLFHFDTEVDEDSVQTWKRGQSIPPRRTRIGGTDFQAPTDWVNSHPGRFDGLLIVTDGECSAPGPCHIKRGWIIVPGRKLLFETNEIVCQMKQETQDNS